MGGADDPMTPYAFVLLNLAVCSYNVGTIWAHEVDIFRSWRLIPPEQFHLVQAAHWRKLPYWVFIPVGLALVGSIALVAYHPADVPIWALLGQPHMPGPRAGADRHLLGAVAV